MKKYEVILLSAERGYRLYNKETKTICIAVQLPLDSDLSVWEEITDAEAQQIELEMLNK